LTAADIDRMKNKPSLWMLAAGAFAFIAIMAYLIFALTLAEHMEPYPVPEDKATAPKSGV
jgi:hypothetical protein